MNIHKLFLEYYGNIKLKKYKTEKSPGQEYTIYGCKVPSGLNLNRYIFIVIDGKGPEETTLDQLKWINFQTRTTEDYLPLPSISYTPTKEPLSMIVNVLERENNKTVYLSDVLPIKITALHDPKKKNNLQYPDQCKLYQILEVYRTVIDVL